MKQGLEQKFKIIVAVQFISTLAILLFWLGYYLYPFIPLKTPAFYSNTPQAIPAPDVVLFILMLVSGLLVLKENKLGHLLTKVLAIVLIYLGIIGIQFEISNGMVLVSMVSMLKSGFVNLWCIVFGFYFLLKLRPEKKKDKT